MICLFIGHIFVVNFQLSSVMVRECVPLVVFVVCIC